MDDAQARTSAFGKSETHTKKRRVSFLHRLFALIILCACALFLSSLSILVRFEEENAPVLVLARRSIASPLEMTVHAVLWYNTAQVQAAVNSGVDMIINHSEDEIEALTALADKGKYVVMPNSTALDILTDRMTFQRWMMDAGYKENLPLVWDRVWKRHIPYPVIIKVSTLWDRNSGLPGTVMAWNKGQFESISKKLNGVDWHMEESIKGREEYAIHFVAVHGVMLDAFECSSFISHVSPKSVFVRDHRLRPFKDTFRNCSGLPHSADVAALLSSFTVATCYHGFGVLRYKINITSAPSQHDETQNATFKIVALRAGVNGELNEAPERLAPMIVEFWKAYRRQSRSPGSLVTRLRGHLARGKYVVGTPPTSLSLRKQMLKEALSVDADKATAEALGSTFEELPPGNLSAPGNVEVGSASSASEARIGNQTTSGHLPTSSIGLPIDMMERGIDQSRDARSISDRDLARGESKHKGMDGEGGRRQDVDSGVLHPASTIGRVLTAFGNSQRLWNEWHLDSDPSDDSDDGVGHEGLDSEGGAQFDKDEKEKEEQEEEEDMDPRDVTAMDLQQWWVVRRGAEEGEEATPNRDDADGDDGEDEDEDEEEVEEQGGGGPFSLNGGGHSGARFGEFLGLEHGWEDFEESLALPLNHYRDHDLPDENDNDAEDHYIGSENDPREQGMGESEDDGALVDTFEPTYRASLISDEGEDEVDDVSKADENSRFTLSPDQTVTRTDNLNEEQEQGSF